MQRWLCVCLVLLGITSLRAAEPGAELAPAVAVHLEVLQVPTGTIKKLAKFIPEDGLKGDPNPADDASTVTGGVVDNTSSLMANIEQMRRKRNVTTLAAPKLTITSGQTGSIETAKEIAIPVAAPGNTFDVEKKPVGLNAKVTPNVQANGDISLAIHVENSEARYDDNTRVNGISVPTFTKMAVSTNCDLKPGKTLVLAGISRQSNAQAKQPKLLGKLLPQKGARETETIVLVRAETTAGVPTTNIRPPNRL